MRLAFKIIRTNGNDELIAQADNLPVGRAAYREACRQYPRDIIELRNGARIIEANKPGD
jgi:hypothetical protein